MMNIRNVLGAMAVFAMVGLVACGGGGGVTGPSSGNKTATLALGVTNVEIRPLGGGWSYVVGGQDTIRETSGVGVQLQSAIVTIGTQVTTVSCSGRVPAGGQTSSAQVCTYASSANRFYTGWTTFDAIRIGDASMTIQGVDDNGHAVSASANCGVYAKAPTTGVN
jgi:hypothetical protein